MVTTSHDASPHISLLSVAAVVIIILAMLVGSVEAADWNSPQELFKELKVYQGFTLVTIGIHMWEHIISFQFEWEVYTGKVPFRYGMLAYWIIRYSMWASLISTLVNIMATTPINCEASLLALLITLSLSTMATSLIFIVRCIAVWQKNGIIAALLASLWITTAGIHFSSPTRIHSTFMNNLCITSYTAPMWKFNLAYLFVEITDLITFVLSAYRLRRMHGTTGLSRILFQQSVLYVGVSTVLNTICLAFIYADFNAIMAYMVSPFAMTISGILACRSFRDLQVSARKSGTISGVSNGQIWVGSGGPPSMPHTPKGDNSSKARSSLSVPVDARRPTELNATRGRTLGLAKREDWLAKSGLQDIDYPATLSKHHRVGVSSNSLYAHHQHARGSSVGRSSAFRSRAKAFYGTGSSNFHGFALPEEEEEEDEEEPAEELEAVSAERLQSLNFRRRQMIESRLPHYHQDIVEEEIEEGHQYRGRDSFQASNGGSSPKADVLRGKDSRGTLMSTYSSRAGGGVIQTLTAVKQHHHHHHHHHPEGFDVHRPQEIDLELRPINPVASQSPRSPSRYSPPRTRQNHDTMEDDELSLSQSPTGVCPPSPPPVKATEAIFVQNGMGTTSSSENAIATQTRHPYAFASSSATNDFDLVQQQHHEDDNNEQQEGVNDNGSEEEEEEIHFTPATALPVTRSRSTSSVTVAEHATSSSLIVTTVTTTSRTSSLDPLQALRGQLPSTTEPSPFYRVGRGGGDGEASSTAAA